MLGSNQSCRGQNIQMLRFLEIGFSHRLCCNGSALIACSWLTSNSNERIPPQERLLTKQYFFSLFTPVTVDTGVRSTSNECFLCCHHTAPGISRWGLKLEAESGTLPNPGCFPEGEPMRLEPSWSNGKILLPSESERREMLLIKASLQVCAC